MTDINEIIGRALLNVDPGYVDSVRGHIVEADERDASLLIEATVKITDIGAAVVKALGEAGYEIRERKEPPKFWTRLRERDGGWQADIFPGDHHGFAETPHEALLFAAEQWFRKEQPKP